jgi:MFS family permease
VAFGALLGYIVYSTQYNSTYGVFIFHLQQELGWSRGALVGATSLARIPEIFISPSLGAFVDRHGSRRVLVWGAVLTGVGFFLLATVTELWQYYLFRSVVLALGALLLSPMIMSITLNQWFVERRGRALAFSRLGDTLGSGIMPVVVALLIAYDGWRFAWIVMGIFVLVVCLPSSRLFWRRPEDYGLRPDGLEEGEEAKPRSGAAQRRRAELLAADVPWTRGAALRTTALWALVFANGFSSMGVVAANLHLVPYMQDLGYSLTVAAAVVGGRAWIWLVITPIWGFLVERVPVKPAAASQFFLAGVSMVMFGVTTVDVAAAIPALPFLAMFVFGVASAGFYMLTEVIWANYFGRVSLGTVRGIAHPITALLSALGPWGMGVLFDLQGSYQLAWMILAIGLFIATVLMFVIQPPKPPPSVASIALS